MQSSSLQLVVAIHHIDELSLQSHKKGPLDRGSCVSGGLTQKRIVIIHGRNHVSLDVLLPYSLLSPGNPRLQCLGSGFREAICAQGALVILRC